MSGRFSRRVLRRAGLLLFLVATIIVAIPAAQAVAAYPTYITSDWGTTTKFPVAWYGPGSSYTTPDGTKVTIPAAATIDVQYKDGSSGAWRTWLQDSKASGATFTGAYGHTYWFRTRWQTASNGSAWSGTISYAVPYDNGSLKYSSGWGYATAKGYAFNNTIRYSTKAGTSMSYSFTGKRVVIVATKAKGRGKFAVYLDGSSRVYKYIDTYYYQTRYRRHVFDYTFPTYGNHKIVIKNLGTRGRPRIDLDAVAVVRPDVTGPTGSIVAPAYSKEQTPTISLISADNVGVSQVKLAANSALTGAVTQPLWASPTDTKWNLGATEGAKTIYARFYDEAGNASALVSRALFFDKTKSTVVASGNTTIPIGVARTIDATVTDASPVTVELLYRPVAISTFETATMTPASGRFTADIPATATLTNVEYYVRATDAAGNMTELGPFAVGALDVTPPEVPLLTAATPGDRSASIAWSTVMDPDLAGYRLYRSGGVDGPWTMLTDTQSTAYTDTSVLNGHSYFFAVRSYDASGNQSALSTPWQAVLPQKLASLNVSVPPTATVGQSFTATVTATDDNGDPYLPELTVDMTENGPGTLTPTALTLTGGSGTGQFSYATTGDIQLTATSSVITGTSGTLTIESVPSPTGLVATPFDRRVDLAWNAVNGYGVTSYRVYRSDVATGTWSQIATASVAATPTYVDSTALNGHTYQYQVSAYGPYDNESGRSSLATATLPQKLASLTVTVPATTIVGQSFTTTVTATDDNGKPYLPTIRVTMSEDGTGSISPTTLNVSGGSASGSFTYSLTGDIRVTATYLGISGQSATMTVQPVPAPAGLTATPGDHKVDLAWNAVNGYGVTSYRVYRADVATGTWSQIATASVAATPTYTDTTALNGHTYQYRVTAYGPTTNESSNSNTATAVLPQKLASLSLQVPAVAIVGQSFTATVTAADDNGKPYTTGMTVAMSEDGTGALTPTTLDIPASSSSASGSFRYMAGGSAATGAVKITATNGSTSTSATVSMQPVPAPTGLAANGGDHKVSLGWSALGYGVTNYRIYRATDTTPWAQIASIAATASPAYTDTSTPNGDKYYYQVSGYSTDTGEGLRSGSATATLVQKLASLTVSVPSTATVGQQFNVTVTAKDDNGVSYTPTVTVNMTANGSGELTPSVLSVTGGSRTASFSYSVTGDIKISAASGTISGQSTTMTVEGVPAPTGLAAIDGDRRANLSWTAVNSSYGVTNYRIYRAPGGTGTWTQIASIAATPSPSYSDTGVLNGSTYDYRVTAYGPGTNESAASSVVTTILPQKLVSMTVSVPSTITVGQSFTATVTAMNDNGQPFTDGLSLTVGENGTGTLDHTDLAIAQGTGTGSGTFVYTDTVAGTLTLSLSDTDPVTGLPVEVVSDPIDVLLGP